MLKYGIQIYDHKLYFVFIKKNSQSYISEARPQYIKLHGHSPYYTIKKNMGDNLWQNYIHYILCKQYMISCNMWVILFKKHCKSL
jgi:hypothetical protein